MLAPSWKALLLDDPATAVDHASLLVFAYEKLANHELSDAIGQFLQESLFDDFHAMVLRADLAIRRSEIKCAQKLLDLALETAGDGLDPPTAVTIASLFARITRFDRAADLFEKFYSPDAPSYVH